jgi:DinB superfamily
MNLLNLRFTNFFAPAPPPIWQTYAKGSPRYPESLTVFAMPSSETKSLPPQLETCAHDFQHASEDARNLLTYTDEDALRKRRSPANWSALECVVHLNLATQAMLPGIRRAVEEALPSSSDQQRYKMDFAGRLLAWSLEPPVFIKLKAPKLAQPLASSGPEPVWQEFERLHAELIELLQASAGKAIDQQKMKSPFANMHYSAYSAFRIIAAHDRRHLWQARKSLEP